MYELSFGQFCSGAPTGRRSVLFSEVVPPALLSQFEQKTKTPENIGV